MSSVDKRIVEMEFDNKQFEKGVSTTINSIDDLKKSLNFSGVEKNFDKITSGFEGIKLGGVADAVESITSKFSILGTVGDQVLRTITDTITSKVLVALGEMTDMLTGIKYMTDGFQEYELKMRSIQTIAANTGALSNKAVADLSEAEEQAAQDVIKGLYSSGEARRKQLEEAGFEYDRVQSRVNDIMSTIQNNGKKTTSTMNDINASLDELNTYADKTIYNFAQMTDAIGKFTVAGIDLETSTEAVKGIANLAALSGASNDAYYRTLYNLSQSMSTGSLQTVDWRSLEMAGMGGQQIQKAIIDAGKHSADAAAQQMAASIESGSIAFRDSLKKKWVTNDILLQALQQFTAFTDDMSEAEIEAEKVKWRNLGYTEKEIEDIQELSRLSYEAATKVRTYTQLMDTLKEEIGSSYTNMWQNIFGDFNEATELWTGIHDVIEDNFIKPMTTARDIKWSYFHDNGGRDAAIKGFANVGNSMLTIMNAIRDAWHAVFPPDDGKRITAIAKAFAEFSENLKFSDDTIYKIKTTFQGMFSVLHIGYELIKTIAPYAIKILSVIAPKILTITSFIGEQLIKLDEYITKNKTFDTILQNVFKIIGFIVRVIKEVANSFDDIIEKIDKFLDKIGIALIFNTILDNAKGFVTDLPNIINSLENKDVSGVTKYSNNVKNAIGSGFDKVLPIITKVLDKVKLVVGKITSIIKTIISTIGNVVEASTEGISLGDVLLTIIGAEAFKIILDYFSKINNIRKSFINLFKNTSDLFTSIKDMFNNVTEVLSGVKDVLKAYTLEIKTEALKNIAVSILIICGALIALTLVDPEKLQSSVLVIGEVIGILMTSVTILSKGSTSIKSAATAMVMLTTLSLSLLMLLPVILLLGTFDKTAEKGIRSISKIITILIVAITALTKLTKDIRITQIISISIAMLALTAAIDLLTPAILILSLLPEDKLNNGIGAFVKIIGILTVGFTALALLTKNLSSAKLIGIGIAINEIAIAVNVLIIPIIALSLIPADNLKKSVLALTAILAELAIISVILPKDSSKMAKSIIKLAEALVIIALSLKILSTIDTQSMVVSSGALILVLGSIVAALKLLDNTKNIKQTTKNIKSISNAILVISVSLKILSTIDTKRLYLTIGAIVLLFGAMTLIGSMGNFDGKKLESIANSVVRLGLVFIEFGAACYLVAKAIEILSKVDFGEANYKNFGNVLSDLFIGLKESIPELIDLIREIAIAVLNLVGEVTPKIINTFLKIVSGVLEAIAKELPTILDSIFKIIIAILDALIDYVKPVVDKIITLIIDILDTIADNMSDIINSAANLFLSIVEGVNDWLANDSNRQRLRDDIEMLIALIVLTIGEFAVDLFSAGWDLIKSMGKGIASAGSMLYSSIKEAISNAINWIKNTATEIWDAIKEIGANIINGIVEGFKSAKKGLSKALGKVVDFVVDKFEGGFDTHSPSKVTERIGRFVGEGLAVGITDSTKNAINSADGLTNAVIDTVNSINDNVDDPVITPVMDLSDFNYDQDQLNNMSATMSKDLKTKFDFSPSTTSSLVYNMPEINADSNLVADAVDSLKDQFGELKEYISKIGIRMDTGALVGAMVSPLDRELGNQSILKGRYV